MDLIRLTSQLSHILYEINHFFDLKGEHELEAPIDDFLSAEWSHGSNGSTLRIENYMEPPDILLKIESMKEYAGFTLVKYSDKKGIGCVLLTTSRRVDDKAMEKC